VPGGQRPDVPAVGAGGRRHGGEEALEVLAQVGVPWLRPRPTPFHQPPEDLSSQRSPIPPPVLAPGSGRGVGRDAVPHPSPRVAPRARPLAASPG
jgi:hypothetical protein